MDFLQFFGVWIFWSLLGEGLKLCAAADPTYIVESDSDSSYYSDTPRRTSHRTRKHKVKYQHHPRSAHHHGSNPNKKKLKIQQKGPLPSLADEIFDEDDPALALNGELKVIWAVRGRDGYYYWSWKKFERWVFYNWERLNHVQQVAVNTLRTLYKNPNDWGSKGTERHHMVPKSCGGNEGMDPRWCVPLTFAHHLVAHVALMVILPNSPSQEALSASVDKMMLGPPRQIDKISDIILQSGASKEFLREFTKHRALAHERHSERMSGENHPMYGKHHTEATKQKISESRTGFRHTETTKQKMSESKTGIPTGRDMSGKNNFMYGKQHSAESKAKMSAAKSRWTKEHDLVLAKLTLLFAATFGKRLDWNGIRNSDLMKEKIPKDLQDKAKNRVNNLKKNQKPYWLDLINEAKQALDAEV